MNAMFQDATVDVVDEDDMPLAVVKNATNARVGAAPSLVLPGRYQDLGELGRGSFGAVHRVRDTLLDRVVAMKILRAEHAHVEHIRRRFSTEVRITAQLQHPGIVAVHDRGELSDGRLWFTMKEIRGRTLSDVSDELHKVSDHHGFGTTTSGWTFRRLVDAFTRIVQAMAYAHLQNIVHRDLKPENLMVGEFGEVLVMDWGLARRVDSAEVPTNASIQEEDDPTRTQHGDVLGTPAYMPPEQAHGALALHGPASDVYSLGAVLYCLLTGKAPYDGTSSREVLMKVLTQAPTPIPERTRIPVPDELRMICEKAMQREISARYLDAAAMAQDLVAWLDGVRLREQALDALQQARVHEPEIARIRQEAQAAKKNARDLHNELRPYDPVEKKRPAWDLEDQARRLGRTAALLETKWLEAVHGALSIDARLPEAHDLLADHYRERLLEAEREHREEDAARAEELLRSHDRGRHAAFLRGDGRLSLVTNPAGADVLCDRFVSRDRRLVAEHVGMLGQTPLRDVTLPHGSYLLRLRSPGHTEVRYPVLIERDGTWTGVAPFEDAPWAIDLPRDGDLGPDEVYVPAGWCSVGGDAEAADGLPRRRIWVDAFVMGKFAVTNAEYAGFLNDLVARGKTDDALRYCPRIPGSIQQNPEVVFTRNAEGLFSWPATKSGRFPVILVDWFGASAYAAWLSDRTGKPWRLPNELEWEKAARGTDMRTVPWGNHLDATFACVLESHRNAPSAVEVDAFEHDVSPYGVRGLAGNVRDWCINVWKMEGPVVTGERLQRDAASREDDDFRIIRGGAWGHSLSQSRSATRFGGRPTMSWHAVGFRVVRTFNRG